MSYDLILINRLTDQTWEEALELYERLMEDRGDLTPEMDRQTWSKVVDAVRGVNPDVEDVGEELEDEEFSITVQCWSTEASVSVPYWHTGPTARAAASRMYAYALAMEAATGFEAYDPQLEVAVAEADPGEAAAVFDSVWRSLNTR